MMKKQWVTLFVLAFALQAFANIKTFDARKTGESILPEKVKKLVPGKATEKDVVAALGAPKLKENDRLYYNVNGVDYDLTFEMEKGIVSYISYDVPSTADEATGYQYSSIEKFLTDAQKNEVSKNIQKQKGHDRGRTFDLVFDKEASRFTFSGVDPHHRLKSVTLWKTAGKGK